MSTVVKISKWALKHNIKRAIDIGAMKHRQVIEDLMNYNGSIIQAVDKITQRKMFKVYFEKKKKTKTEIYLMPNSKINLKYIKNLYLKI